VKQKYPVRYDSDNDNQCVVVQPKKQVVFQQSGSGLYYHNNTNRVVVMVNTVEDNREGYTDRAYSTAKQARRALGMVGYPSEKDFKHMVSSNMIRNYPVTPKDIIAANNIFGPNAACMKGKTVRATQDPVLTEYVEIPKRYCGPEQRRDPNSRRDVRRRTRIPRNGVEKHQIHNK
jgi:hypothetical protein